MTTTLGLPKLGSLWFEFDPTKTIASQFDTILDGSSVTSSTATIVTVGGLKWIQLSITYNGDSGNGKNQSSILPVTKTPPSANYVISADVRLVTAASDLVLCPLLYVRVGTIDQGYLLIPALNDTTRHDEIYKQGAGAAHTALAGSGTTAAFPNVALLTVFPSVLGCIGTDTGLVWLMRMLRASSQWVPDASSPYVSGKAGIGMTGCGSITGSTQVAQFRNIRCHTLLAT